MQIVENKNAADIIKLIIPEKILNLNPVIAGGFIAAIYYLAIRYSNEILDKDLEFKIQKYKNSNSRERDIIDHLKLDGRFGDVDFWFLKDNKVLKPEAEYPNLFSQFMSDGKFKAKSQSKNLLGRTGMLASAQHFHKSFYYEAETHAKEFGNLLGPFTLLNSTGWANTFRVSSGLTFQFVKKTFDDIDQLFGQFDITNCCAAYYDGKFYFHDNFQKASDLHAVSFNKTQKNHTLYSKLWTAGRIIKYAKRLDFDLSPKVCSFMVQVAIDAQVVMEKISAGQYNLDDLTIELESTPYGITGTAPIEAINNYVNLLHKSFHLVLESKNFKKGDLYLLLHINELHSQVQKHLK